MKTEINKNRQALFKKYNRERLTLYCIIDSNNSNTFVK